MAREQPSARFEFPIMLYGMLEDCTFDDDLCHIVSWQPHGLSFKVHDREGFERILPRWFKEKYESFRCLLEQWGFVKLSRGKDRGCWYQVNFGHGRKSKLQNISKDDFLRGMPEYLSPREEPNLYSMETLESSIVRQKTRLKTLRDHSASAATAATPISDHHSAANSSGSKSSSHKRSRDGDDSSMASGSATNPPPSKKEKKSKRTTPNTSTSAPPPPPSAPAVPPPPPSAPAVPSPPAPPPDGGGCKVCGRDDDHSNLLLCEGCDTESHTYCLDPPLDAVPDEDWFCDKCARRMDRDRKELTKLIKTIPEGMRSRFGEVCFSKSGERAHFWPAMLFDPRTFLHNKDVVELCKRNLGKRFLVFFFENQDAFAAVPKSWIIPWDEGVKKGFDKGKTVRNGSKAGQEQYEQALEAARLAMLGSTDVESKHSDSSPEESIESQHEVTPMSPLKEVEDDSVLCSKCGKILDMAEGPVLADGYWQCHDCHKKAQALLVAKNPPPRPVVVAKPPPSNASTPTTKPPATKPKSESKPFGSADATWLAARDDAIHQVGGSESPQVEIDDEILKGITQRPSGKWQAQVYYAGKSRYIGVFETRQKAALAFKLVRSKLRPGGKNAMPVKKRMRKNVDEGNGTVHSSLASMFTKKHSTTPGNSRASSFTDKKPDTEKAPPGGHEVAVNVATPRYIDTERTKILLETPLCRYYSDIPICDL